MDLLDYNISINCQFGNEMIDEVNKSFMMTVMKPFFLLKSSSIFAFTGDGRSIFMLKTII